MTVNILTNSTTSPFLPLINSFTVVPKQVSMEVIKEPSPYHCYAFSFPYHEEIINFCRYLKEKYGWKEINFQNGKWRFSLPQILEEIMNTYPQVSVPVEIILETGKQMIFEKEKELQNQLLSEIKEKTESSLEIKGLKLPLLNYQKVGVEFLVNSNHRIILADQAGLGKTCQTLAYLIAMKIPKTLVICPASVKYVWQEEVKKWTKFNAFVIDGQFLREVNLPEMLKVLSDHEIFIINYDLIARYLDVLVNLKFDCLVLDEFQYIKSLSSARSKAARIISRDIEKVICLSGTPILNRPVELFPVLNVIDSRTWNSWFNYTKKFCNGHYGYFGWDATGASHLDELQKLIQPYFLRRLKDDVMSELPSKRFIDVPIKLENSIRKKYKLAEDALYTYLKSFKNKTDEEIAKSLAAEQLVRLNELRQLSSEGKTDAAKDLIEDIITNEEKVVVYSCFNDPLLQLKEEFNKEAVLLIGSTDDKDRQKAIEKFQNDPKTKIFLGGIKSAGVGLTLTASPNVLFLDYSWVPADHQQAQDRIHRIGQKASSVNIYQLYALDTIDEYIRKTLKSKQKIFDQLIEGRASETLMRETMKNYLVQAKERE